MEMTALETNALRALAWSAASLGEGMPGIGRLPDGALRLATAYHVNGGLAMDREIGRSLLLGPLESTISALDIGWDDFVERARTFGEPDFDLAAIAGDGGGHAAWGADDLRAAVAALDVADRKAYRAIAARVAIGPVGDDGPSTHLSVMAGMVASGAAVVAYATGRGELARALHAFSATALRRWPEARDYALAERLCG